MLLRWILIGLVVYLGYRLFKGLNSRSMSREDVKGKQKHEPLDLRNSDVEDADFEDIQDDEH
ncbi:hypothetical protein JW824_10955 [bacterium]|nr:hypothetical protein [bacterium]